MENSQLGSSDRKRTQLLWVPHFLTSLQIRNGDCRLAELRSTNHLLTKQTTLYKANTPRH